MKMTNSIPLLFITLLAVSVPAQAADQFLEVIALPNSWGPEGIASGRGTDFFAGARQQSPFQGAIYKGDFRTGEGDILVPSRPGRFALGMKVDERTNLLFVAGGPSGAGYIYDATTGDDVAVLNFTTAASFVNDVVVTRDAAYFTDSLNAFIYLVPLGLGGKLPAEPSFIALPLTGDFQQVTGFNVNGIVATPNGESLIIVQSATGLIFKVDPSTGITEMIDLGGELVTSGDGLWLDGQTLYVVRNQLNRIAVVELDHTLTTGEYLEDITNPNFDIPTTVTEFGNSLYAVNARFSTPIFEAEYQIVRVSK